MILQGNSLVNPGSNLVTMRKDELRLKPTLEKELKTQESKVGPDPVT